MTRQEWNAEKYRIHANFVSKLGKPVIEILQPKSGERILDLGCGDGTLMRELMRRGCRPVGVDLDP